MNKSEFLKDLGVRLKYIKRDEKDKFIAYYNEIIEDYKEEEAVKRIGSPEKIAEEIMAEKDNAIIKIPSTASKIVNGILLTLGFPLWGVFLLAGALLTLSVLFAAVLVIISTYMLLWMIPLITGTLGIGLFVVSAVSLIGSFFLMISSFSVGLVQLGIGMLMGGISILSVMATMFFAKTMTYATKRISKKAAEGINLIKKFIMKCFKYNDFFKERVEIIREKYQR